MIHLNLSQLPSFARLLCVLALATSVLALSRPPTAVAATFTVTKTTDSKDGACNSDCSLREAIIAAHQQAGVDTITLRAGTYRVTLSDLDITSSLTIIGAGAATTIIESNGQDRVFEVRPGITVTIDNVTVRNGKLSQGNGAGILNNGTLTLSNSIVSSNGVVAYPYAGGGIYTTGTLMLTQSTVSGNWTQNDGGGIFNHGGTVTLSSSTVRGNNALFNGGGIFNTGMLTLTTSTVWGNATDDTVSDGGGIYNDTTGTLILRNSTVSSNELFRDGTGGGISNQGMLTLANSTITGNSGSGGSPGVHTVRGASTTMHNTIIAGNTGSTSTPDCAGTVISQGYNLIGNAAGCTITGDTTGNLLGSNPQLGPLQNNGGPTLTHLPASGSPVIDAGNPAAPGSAGSACATTDQRGQTRPTDGNGDGTARCDIGAVER